MSVKIGTAELPFITFSDLVDIALDRARLRGGSGKISFRPDVDGDGISMFVDDELVARGLDPAEILQASGRLDGPPTMN
jgi:hypothetical protein